MSLRSLNSRRFPPSNDNSVGLGHVALKIGDTMDQFRAAKCKLETAGIEINAID